MALGSRLSWVPQYYNLTAYLIKNGGFQILLTHRGVSTKHQEIPRATVWSVLGDEHWMGPYCYSWGVECPLTGMLKACSPGLCSWKVVEPLVDGTYWEVLRSLGVLLKGMVGPQPLIFSLLLPGS